MNADIRYQIINEQALRFAIDPVTGRVRVVAALTRDAGRVFGFDVKATDKRGADDGKSAIANVFVSIVKIIKLAHLFNLLKGLFIEHTSIVSVIK